MRSKSLVAAALLGALFASQTFAAEKPANYPSRPVEIIVPYAAGGGLDICVRLLGKYAEQKLGQRIVVSNKTGGGNIAGKFEGIKARPDGYTLGAWGSEFVTDELLLSGVPYSYKDVTPLCMFANDPEIFVIGKAFSEKNGITTLRDFIEFCKANPGRVTIGMGGNWTPHDYLRIKVEEMTGVKFNRMPFAGGNPALQAAAAGNCDAVVAFLPEVVSVIDNGLLVPLAVAFGSRVEQFPDLPTVAEAGYPGMTQSIWRILTIPNNTPEGIVEYLASVFENTVNDPAFQSDARRIGMNPVFMGPKELKTFVDEEHEYYVKRTGEWGIRVKK